MNKLSILIILLLIPIVKGVGSIELPARMEYKTGEIMTLYAQVLNESSRPVSNATCMITIYYPDRTVWVNDENLTHLSDDLYYFNKTLTSETGVFVYEINCSYPVIYAAEIFHVGAEWVGEIGDIKEKTDLLDDVEDDTDKIPLISNTISLVSVNLQNIGMTQRESFLYALILLVIIIIIIAIAIIVFIWHTLKVGFFERNAEEAIDGLI